MVDVSQSLLNRGVDMRFSPRAITPPPAWLARFNALGLPFTPTVTVYDDRVAPVGSIGITSVALFDLFSTARTAPVNTYYVTTGGSDGNAGTAAAPFATMGKARDAANASGQPAKVIVAAGEYTQGFSATPSAGGNAATVDICWIARGGRVNTGSWSVQSLTADGTYPNIYSSPIGNFDRVLDRINLNAFGNFSEMAQVSTAAICSRTPNSYAYVSGTLYVNRIDGLAPTAANTRVIRANQQVVQYSTPVNIAFLPETGGDAWDFEGGNLGVANLVATSLAANPKAIVFDSCSFKYGGGVTNAGGKRVVRLGHQRCRCLLQLPRRRQLERRFRPAQRRAYGQCQDAVHVGQLLCLR